MLFLWLMMYAHVYLIIHCRSREMKMSRRKHSINSITNYNADKYLHHSYRKDFVFYQSHLKSQLLSIWIDFLNCNIKSTITIIPIIINLIDAEWPIVLSLMNEHNKPIIIQHRAWDTFCMFILILFCGSFTSGAKLLLQY